MDEWQCSFTEIFEQTYIGGKIGNIGNLANFANLSGLRMRVRRVLA